MLRIAITVGAALLSAPAWCAQTIESLTRLHKVCESHKTNFLIASQVAQKPYADGWEKCFVIEVEYQKQIEAAYPDMKSVNDAAKDIAGPSGGLPSPTPSASH